MGKTKKTKKNIFSTPCAILKNESQVLFLYAIKDETEQKIYLSESSSGFDFSKKNHAVEVISESGEFENLSNCESFRLATFDGTHYLTYTRTFKKWLFLEKTETIIAKSKGLEHFHVVERITGKPIDSLSIVSKHKHREKFLAYHSDYSIYVSASSDLKNWHASGKLLSPREDRFDNNPLSLISALATEKGILVLYDSIAKKKGHKRELQIGAALFSLDSPYKILWRSDDPIWKKNLDRKDCPKKYIGCVFLNDLLNIYWLSEKNEVFFVSVDMSSLGLKKFKKGSIQLSRHHGNPILKPIPENSWEQSATFNPAALHLDEKIHLLYRAIGDNGLSVFGYASSNDGLSIDQRSIEPAFAAMKISQFFKKTTTFSPASYMSGGSWIGCEDPRITQVGNRIYMTYVSYDGANPPGVALTSISTRNFINKDWKWKNPVLISKSGEIQKNWVLFPEKINGKYAILHSITPTISIEYIKDLDKKGLVIESEKKPGKDEHRWDNIVRGAGAPPLKTKYGWLVLYHAMDKRDPNKYKVGAMILDSKDPTKILYRSDQPILEPIANYENEGAKAGVVYVCGAVIKDETLFVYYGGADSVVCVATADADAFLKDLVKSKTKKNNRSTPLKKIKQPLHN